MEPVVQFVIECRRCHKRITLPNQNPPGVHPDQPYWPTGEIGIYSRGGQRRYAGQLYRDLVRESLRTFVWPDLLNEPVQQVWVIGPSIATAIQGICGLPPSKMLPNAGLHLAPGGGLVIDPTHIIPQPGQAGHEDGLQRLIASIS